MAVLTPMPGVETADLANCGHDFGQAFEAVADEEEHVTPPRFFRSISTFIQNFAPSPSAPNHRPRMLLVAVYGDADGRVDRTRLATWPSRTLTWIASNSTTV